MYEVEILKRTRLFGMEYYPTSDTGIWRVINTPTFERMRKFGICGKHRELNPADLSKYEGTESGPCVVVGGGPSLLNMDWGLLDKWDCIACNMAIRYVPHAKYMVSMDFTPIILDPDKLKDAQAFKGFVFVKYDGSGIHPEAREFDVVEDKPPRYLTESLTEGVHAVHSGQAATQIAMHLGYNPIYLLGIDCKMGPKFSPFHHYDDGLEYEYDDPRMAMWATVFNAQAVSYAEKGIGVINLGPDSALSAFESRDWRAVLSN